MIKTVFIAKSASTEIDAELERTMQLIHDRMEKMLETQNARRVRVGNSEVGPTYFR